MTKLTKALAVLTASMMMLTGCAAGGAETPSTGENNTVVEETAPEEAKTITVTHEYGEVEVPVNPSSVAVFDMTILDTINALGVEAVTGVASTSTPPEGLEKYQTDAYTNVGGMKEPDYETLFELEPEIIFIGGRTADQYDELSKIAPVVYISTDQDRFIDSVEENTMTIAQIFGKEDEAVEMVADLRAQVEAIEEQVIAEDIEALIIMASAGEISAFGADSRYGAIHKAFGFKEAGEGIEEVTHGQIVTFEFLLEVDPEYLFVVDRNVATGDAAIAEQVLDNDLVRSMQASQNDNIVYLDPSAWYLAPGGLSATQTMIDDIAGSLK